jgi:acyl-CoA thioester hydrolase
MIERNSDPKAHVFPIRVYYEDTDFSGIVYHANYLRFIERARTELLRDADLHQAQIHAGEQIFFVVARMTIEFLRPARMDDLLSVETRIERMTAATLELDQRVQKGEELLFTARVLIAAVAGGRACRIPAEIRKKLAPRG